MYQNLAVLAVFAFLYSIVAGRIDRTPINGALVFMVFGIAAGPLGLSILDINITRDGLRNIANITLALVLFIDAANANRRVLKNRSQIPFRMLLFGLPLVIVFGMLAGAALFDEFDIYQLAILATILAATDAALGKQVITNKAVPARIREGLNAESGLNDGLCVPILFIFIALEAEALIEGGSTQLALTLVAREIGIGLLVGLGITALGVRMAAFCHRRGWVTEIWMQLTAVALAMSCFAVAQSLHGSGYIAAFAGGLLFGAMAKSDTHAFVKAGEGVAETLALITWVIFGAVVVAIFYDRYTWTVLLYSVLSLTVIRMLPMFLVLARSGESTSGKLFIGWFGPRGLASIVFTIIVIEKEVPGASTMATIVVTTIVLSVVLHGVTARPLIRRFAAVEEEDPDDGQPVERDDS
jgi:NhaP-type Na+/H+ or K+/H+ antiporter